MWKRKRLKKKIHELELELGQIKAVITANKKVLIKIYNEYDISKIQMEIESQELNKILIENKLKQLKNKLND